MDSMINDVKTFYIMDGVYNFKELVLFLKESSNEIIRLVYIFTTIEDLRLAFSNDIYNNYPESEDIIFHINAYLLKHLRDYYNVTQVRLSEITGVHRTSIATYESFNSISNISEKRGINVAKCSKNVQYISLYMYWYVKNSNEKFGKSPTRL